MYCTMSDMFGILLIQLINCFTLILTEDPLSCPIGFLFLNGLCKAKTPSTISSIKMGTTSVIPVIIPDTSNNNQSRFLWFLIFIPVAVILVIILILCLRKRNSRSNMDTHQNSNNKHSNQPFLNAGNGTDIQNNRNGQNSIQTVVNYVPTSDENQEAVDSRENDTLQPSSSSSNERSHQENANSINRYLNTKIMLDRSKSLQVEQEKANNAFPSLSKSGKSSFEKFLLRNGYLDNCMGIRNSNIDNEKATPSNENVKLALAAKSEIQGTGDFHGSNSYEIIENTDNCMGIRNNSIDNENAQLSNENVKLVLAAKSEIQGTGDFHGSNSYEITDEDRPELMNHKISFKEGGIMDSTNNGFQNQC